MTECNLTEEETCSKAEVGHIALDGTDIVVVLDHRADSGETYRSVGVLDSSIEAQKWNYWGKKQHLERANPSELERFADSILSRNPSILVVLRLHSSLQYRTIGFLEKGQRDEEQNAKVNLSEASKGSPIIW